MSIFTSLNSSLTLTPLGAGDLVDRAVRFYRNNFWTFVLIAAPPVVAGTLISLSWMIIGRGLFSIGSSRNASDLSLYYIFSWLGNIFIWMIEAVAALVVMGGASRSFVRHMLFGEPITFKEIYKNIWRRLAGLISASLIITILLGFTGLIIFYIGLIIGALAVAAAIYVFSFAPFIAFIVSIALGAAAITGTLWLFFLLASRFAYVPQVMLVEGQGVFAAIGRSASLASGNVKRLAALFVFTTVAAYSALLLFYVPLAWYAWASGIEFFSFDADMLPAWYQVANQVLSQASLILLMPVWMIGLCLLYIDERVRHEGYDIELMAAQRLGEIPAVPSSFANPLQPALANAQARASEQTRNSPFITLGLK
ncbi:MAG: hypothetical protein JWN60_2040 [Acidobacteria bacterium]|nr:hypothetical protein [Acidobacteriota bacterium]